MPSITTHHFFAKDVTTYLNNKELDRFNSKINIYQTFAQSHDYLFYYKFSLNNKKINQLGKYAHHHNTQDYIINIIKEIQEKKEENNPELLAYLYGVVTHFVLDTTCHPYIFYKTGVYRKKEKDTLKYLGAHNNMEKNIDAIFYKQKTGKEYNKCNVSKEIIGNPTFSSNLKDLINNVYYKTYNHKNVANKYEKAIKHAKLIYTIAINDRFGIKKTIYKILDKIFNKNYPCISNYSTYILKPNKSYLNINNNEWTHPSKKELKYNYSFIELYEQAIKKTVKIIREINKVLYDNQPIEKLLEYIPDLDYSTGIPIKDSKKLRHFEY